MGVPYVWCMPKAARSKTSGNAIISGTAAEKSCPLSLNNTLQVYFATGEAWLIGPLIDPMLVLITAVFVQGIAIRPVPEGGTFVRNCCQDAIFVAFISFRIFCLDKLEAAQKGEIRASWRISLA